MTSQQKSSQSFGEKPLTFAILGAGYRGKLFSRWLTEHSGVGRVVAVADPDEHRRNIVVEMHNIPPEARFDSWEDLLVRPRLADAVINSVMDRQHAASSVAALERGYHIFIEKPMGTTLEECESVDRAQKASGCIVSVSHNLRYDVVFTEVRRLLAEGAIGELTTFDLLEGLDPLHFAHAFVRGNWSNSKRSSPLLLSKSCHDMDIIHAMVRRQCLRVASFGSLTHFRPENAPAGATPFCLDGCPAEPSCLYSARKLYLDRGGSYGRVFLYNAPHLQTLEERAAFLQKSPFGRCVYHSDNDVVDHQVVLFEFEGGLTGTFTFSAFLRPATRWVRLHGTQGFLRADIAGHVIELHRFAEDKRVRYELPRDTSYYAGGDEETYTNFIHALRKGDPSLVRTTTSESLASHKIVFAAERARLESRIVELAELS